MKNVLMEDFVLKYLGFFYILREDVINYYIRFFVKEFLCSMLDNLVIFVFDGIYV